MFHALVGTMEPRTRGWHSPYDHTWLGRLAAAYAVRQLAAQYQRPPIGTARPELTVTAAGPVPGQELDRALASRPGRGPVETFARAVQPVAGGVEVERRARADLSSR